MVYYYGGAFILGTGEMYPGWKLALHGDVIVVNFNYRVSTLGWLASGRYHGEPPYLRGSESIPMSSHQTAK